MSIYFLIFQQRHEIYHDVDAEGPKPVKQHPYVRNAMKRQYLTEEIRYLLDNDFIKSSPRNCISPCILLPKQDGTFCMCTDYRKVNSMTKPDSFFYLNLMTKPPSFFYLNLMTKTDSFSYLLSFPVPRVDTRIDNIGHAKYVTKFDFFKIILPNFTYRLS